VQGTGQISGKSMSFTTQFSKGEGAAAVAVGSGTATATCY